MKIAFVNPPRIIDDTYCIEAEDCCWGRTARHILPYALLACASQLTRHDVKYTDLSIDPKSELVDWSPDVVVYPVYWQDSQHILDKVKDLPGHHVILCYPPGYANEFVTPNNTVIYSEPELAFKHLDASRSINNWRNKISSAVYNSHRMSSTVYENNCIHGLVDMDYSLVPEHYWKKYKLAVYQVTRGCPYKCKFCVWGGSTVTDTTFRRRDPSQVFRDICSIRNLANKHKGIDKLRPIPLYLISSQLTGSLIWLKKFHRLMSPRPYWFQSNVNARELTREKLKLLMEAGMKTTSIGVECLTNRLLKKIGKAHTMEQVYSSVRLLEDSGISYALHLRYGFGEDEHDIDESIHNLKKLKSIMTGGNGKLDIGPFVYYPGTRLGDDANESDLVPMTYRSGVKFMSRKGWDNVYCYKDIPSNIEELIQEVHSR